MKSEIQFKDAEWRRLHRAQQVEQQDYFKTDMQHYRKDLDDLCILLVCGSCGVRDSKREFHNKPIDIGDAFLQPLNGRYHLIPPSSDKQLFVCTICFKSL